MHTHTYTHRQRLTTLHAQHLSFLQDIAGHESETVEQRMSWAKRKSAEFDEMTRIKDLNFVTEYPKIPDGTVQAGVKMRLYKRCHLSLCISLTQSLLFAQQS